MADFKSSLMVTYNVLKINSVSIVPNRDHDHFICLDVELNSKLEMIAENGFPIASIRMITQASGVMDYKEALRRVFQNFLNGHTEYDFQIHKNLDHTEAVINWSTIDRIQVDLSEPLKSEVEKIFDITQWRIPLRMIKN